MAWPTAGLPSATLMGFLPFAALILPAWSEAFPPATTHLPFARTARAPDLFSRGTDHRVRVALKVGDQEHSRRLLGFPAGKPRPPTAVAGRCCPGLLGLFQVFRRLRSAAFHRLDHGCALVGSRHLGQPSISGSASGAHPLMGLAVVRRPGAY